MADVSGRPEYLALAEELRLKIDSGQIGIGDPLPPTSALMRNYGMSSMVVKNAMIVLRATGYVVGHQGKAVYATLPTAPAWLRDLIAAGSGLASALEGRNPQDQQRAHEQWQHALSGVPRYLQDSGGAT